MQPWYEQSFGKDYLMVYKHRDMQGAYHEVKRMVDWLQLPQGAKILDLCCGMGRHSLALHDFGYEVTGIDLSEILLAEARKLDSSEHVKWINGDMRNVPLQKQFAAVVNLFTSFGYFDDDAENGKVLHEIDRLLTDEGKFIIDFLNPAYVEAHLVPYSERDEDGTIIQESRSIEDGCVRKKITIIEEGHENRHYLEQVKLYCLADFQRFMAGTNLTIDATYGYYDGSSYDENISPRLIMVGHKNKSN